ncbi:helix-turn-helix domain-containing protein [Lachnotalea sp. AF33-28]|uniref:helix-turn-helix domain-containing protein n=1 Tax=Lachnotalea sp. AF33-28 TaxID=2292046 RepID=UPI001314DB1F|nr:helix-turn-helix transcriptional regulator [Lachnotalea sp. AF33-28]
MDNQKIGRYIADKRKSKSLTQAELAARLGVTDKAVSKWERGAGCPDISLIKELAAALDITVGELLEGEDEKFVMEDETEEKEEKEEKMLLNAMNYAQTNMKVRSHRVGKVLAELFDCSLILACMICFIVDLAISRALTWSLITASSCLLAGVVITPFFLLKKEKIFAGLLTGSVLLFPYLLFIEWEANQLLGTDLHWFWPLALPITLIWLCILWAGAWIIMKTKPGVFKAAGWYCIAFAFGSAATVMISNSFANSDIVENFWNMLINCSALLAAGVICLCISSIRSR